MITPEMVEKSVADLKWEIVDHSALKPGDKIILYGVEVGVITKSSPDRGSVEYEYKGKTIKGLLPHKAKDGITRVCKS